MVQMGHTFGLSVAKKLCFFKEGTLSRSLIHSTYLCEYTISGSHTVCDTNF